MSGVTAQPQIASVSLIGANVYLCECGCGKPTAIAKKTYSRLGISKGTPNRFLWGHWIRVKSNHGYVETFNSGHPIPEWQKELLSRERRGEKNPGWKGDNASASAGRLRARRAFPVLGLCELCGKNKAVDRHHADDNTKHNSRENIRCLCRRCHMIEDGRLFTRKASGAFASIKNKPSQ